MSPLYKEASTDSSDESAADAMAQRYSVATWQEYFVAFSGIIDGVERDLNTTGLTLADFRVLYTLDGAPGGALQMSHLATELGLSPSGVTRRLDTMVSAGFVQRVASKTDKRVSTALITNSGRHALDEAMPVHADSARRHLIAHLSEEEMTMLNRMSERLRRIRAAHADEA